MFSIRKKIVAVGTAAVLIATGAFAALTPGALTEKPDPSTPLGMADYMREYFEDKNHGWTGNNEPSQDDLFGDFPWRIQYYDANPEWDGFYPFKQMKTDTWGGNSIQNFIFGVDWNNGNDGQAQIQCGMPYLLGDPSNFPAVCFTYIVPKDGKYTLAPAEGADTFRPMHPKYFPGGEEYNDGQYVSPDSTVRYGFAIHRMAKDADMDTYVPSGETKLWPADADYAYITKDNVSVDFPTLTDVELKQGERIRFIVDFRGTSGLENWLMAVRLFPTVTNTDNNAPTAGDLAITCSAGKSASGTLPGKDADAGDTLTYTLANAPAHGSAAIGSDGRFTYTAAAGTAGQTDTFTYTVTDAAGASATGTVNVTIVQNQKPTAGKTVFSVLEGETLSASLELGDADGDALTASVGTQPAHGTLTLAADGTFTYVPADGYTGKDTFVATVADGTDNVEITAEITVDKNVAPVAQNASVKVKKDTAAVITLKAKDDNGTPLTYTLVKQPAHGTAVPENDTVTYTPAEGYTGVDTFTFTASDGKNTSNEAAVRLTVLGEGIDSVDVIKNAVTECGDGADKDKAFDFSSYAYDIPWKLQYRVDGITGSIEEGTALRFETSIAAQIMSWGGYQVSDGSNYPSTTIQTANFLEGKYVHALNSGYYADTKNPVAALTFVAPAEATWLLTGGEVTDRIGIWDGQAKSDPIKVWIEVDGVTVWPENGRPLELNIDEQFTTMPDLNLALKKGAAVRFCVQGTTKNGDHNNIYLDPAAYQIGAYDKTLDPTYVEPEQPDDGKKDPEQPDDGKKDPEQPDDGKKDPDQPDDGKTDAPVTGVALPIAAMAAALGAAGAVFVTRRKKN